MQEQEYSQEEINKLLNGLNIINSTVGSLDMLRVYSKQMYDSDMMLNQGLDKIINDLIKLSGIRYQKVDIDNIKTENAPVSTNLRPVTYTNTYSKPSIKDVDELKSINGTNISKEDTKSNTRIQRHVFINSSSLDEIAYNPVLERLIVVFKKNGRKYAYLGVKQYVVDKIINLDNLKQNPGSYLHYEVIKKIDKSMVREITKDEELLG